MIKLKFGFNKMKLILPLYMILFLFCKIAEGRLPGSRLWINLHGSVRVESEDPVCKSKGTYNIKVRAKKYHYHPETLNNVSGAAFGTVRVLNFNVPIGVLSISEKITKINFSKVHYMKLQIVASIFEFLMAKSPRFGFSCLTDTTPPGTAYGNECAGNSCALFEVHSRYEKITKTSFSSIYYMRVQKVISLLDFSMVKTHRFDFLCLLYTTPCTAYGNVWVPNFSAHFGVLRGFEKINKTCFSNIYYRKIRNVASFFEFLMVKTPRIDFPCLIYPTAGTAYGWVFFYECTLYFRNFIAEHREIRKNTFLEFSTMYHVNYRGVVSKVEFSCVKYLRTTIPCPIHIDTDPSRISKLKNGRKGSLLGLKWNNHLSFYFLSIMALYLHSFSGVLLFYSMHCLIIYYPSVSFIQSTIRLEITIFHSLYYCLHFIICQAHIIFKETFFRFLRSLTCIFLGYLILTLCYKMAEKGVIGDMETDDLYSGAWCGHEDNAAAPRAVPVDPRVDPPSEPPTATAATAPTATATAPMPATSQVNNRATNLLTHRSTHVPSTVPSVSGSVGTIGSGAGSGSTYSNIWVDQDAGAFGRGYVQCKSARHENRTSSGVEVGPGSDLGKSITVQPEKIGNMSLGTDKLLYKTFRGCRITSKGETVNQVISATFDPQTLLCIVCEKEHSIIPADGTDMVVMVSDQNFVSALPGRTACVPIIRLEDPTLKELFDVCLEIFDRCPLPSGTLFLINSVSHLYEMGSTIYSLDWLKMLKDFNRRWQHVKVGPLPPILRETTPATVTKVVTEIWHWFRCVYGTDICFPSAAWDKVLSQLSENTDQILDLASKETYRIALPISLTSSALTHHKFSTSSSLPTTLAISGEATQELLHALLLQLNTKFGCKAHPEDILAREPAELEGMDITTNEPGNVIVIGGSICKKLAADLRDRGVNVTDLTVPGWTPTPTNITKLTKDITDLKPGKNTLVIGDLISNVSFSFEQLTGNCALPVKSMGKYHMFGKVTVSTTESLQHILGKLVPLYQAVPCLKIVLPPLPRYLYSPCCISDDHCVGIGELGYADDLLDKTIGIRKTLRDFLYSRVSNVWVPDALGGLVPGSPMLAEPWRELFSGDGVHLNDLGSSRLADLVKTIVEDKFAASSCVSGPPSLNEYFWRGFVSPVGSSRPKNSAAHHANRSVGGGKWKSRFGGPSGGGGRSYPPAPAPGGRRF